MRLFIAVELGEKVRAALGERIAVLRRLAPDARWLKPEALHVTLAFLGEVPEEGVPPVGQLVTEVAGRHRPLVLIARGGGSFGSSRRPRVLWAGLQGDVDGLSALQRELADGLAALGHRLEERPFSPHLTLCRARDPRGDPKLAACVRELADAAFGEGRIDRVILYKSQLAPGGAIHTPLVEAPLPG